MSPAHENEARFYLAARRGEFRCLECGEEFEKLVRLSTLTSEIECPKCGRRKVDKLISAFSTRISGTRAGSASACAPSAWKL